MKNVEVPDIFSDVFNDKLKTFSVDSRTTVSPHPFSLVAVKAEMSERLPTVKSTDRIEAFARGMGFRSYAAMRVSLDDKECIAPTYLPSGLAFADYVIGKGYDMDSSTLATAFWESLGELPQNWMVHVYPDGRASVGRRGLGMASTLNMPDAPFSRVGIDETGNVTLMPA